MSVSKGILLHAGVFAVASVLALRAYTGEEDVADKHIAAELWKGTADKLEKLVFRTDVREVTVEPKSDETGKYFVYTVVKSKPKKGKTDNPHVKKVKDTPKLSDPEAEKETVRFISLEKTAELVDLIAPMTATRVLGTISDDRLEEFGLDKDQGLIEVQIGGKTHQLKMGGKTPGGGDRYAQDPNTKEGFVVSGSITNPLESAESRLIEREFHGFKMNEVGKVRISREGKTRELVPHKDGVSAWSNPDSPEEKDETAGNWMTKLAKLRVTEYIETPEPPVKPEEHVVRVDFEDKKGKPLGFIELVKGEAEEGDKPDSQGRAKYYGRSAHSRWFATVLRSAAEGLEQDVTTLLEQ